MKNRGFTLIELLVVISIIALLMSILMPAMTKARSQARLIVCASNQKQLLLGVNMYNADNQDFPPSIVEQEGNGRIRAFNMWSYPNYLIYRPKHVSISPSPYSSSSGYVGAYLSDYLKEAKVFNCPMSNKGYANFNYTDRETGKSSTYDGMYQSGNSDFMSCSYFLWWNYFAFDYDLASNKYPKFVGPGKKSNHGLLVSDVVLHGQMWGNNSLNGYWTTTHSFEGTFNSNDWIFHYLYDPNKDQAQKGKPAINAGYADGSVRRYNLNELVPQHTLRSNNEMYIPKDYK
jgi:prepilin-type N-terminal cleavage/methylation domain-containing protein